MREAGALEIAGLEKAYRVGWRQRQEVLRGLTLTVGKGEGYGLLGRNGAGKSTTFRLLTGLARPDGGEARLLGGAPGDRDVKMRVGYCPENPQFPPTLKVVEILRFHSALVRRRILTPKNRIDWLLGQFDLEEYRNRQVRTLSRGSVQKLALALALLGRPELLILDEPLTALDPVARHRVIGIFHDQKNSGTAMIISSHILSELECVADRLGVLAGGVIKKEIDVAAREKERSSAVDIRVPLEFVKEVLADDPDLENMREGESQRFTGVPFERAQKLLKRWSGAGVPILELQAGKSPLEQDVLAGMMNDDTAAEAPQPRVEENV